MWIKKKIVAMARWLGYRLFPGLEELSNSDNRIFISSNQWDNTIGKNVRFYPPFRIHDSQIGDYTYISMNAFISNTLVGKFCSIGPNLVCGWGVHPIDGISTSPMFYSTKKQNGMTFSKDDKIKEEVPITIGNDVFIGANVTILDGVTIGDGAIIGAGAVVSKDIPPYAIAVGCPIRILRYRFDDKTITKIRRIEWWNFDDEKLKDVEQMFFDVEDFINKYNP